MKPTGNSKRPASHEFRFWIDPAMKLSEYLKPALGVAFFAALGVGYYWFEHRSRVPRKRKRRARPWSS